MQTEKQTNGKPNRLGVVIGGSGLIGGTLTYYYKTRADLNVDILAPNSKKLSLRSYSDITRYFLRYRPDFIVNSAIASIDANPQLAYEVNYMGTVHLARVALALKIPYIHFSSAAVMPIGEELTEEKTLPLTADLANYPKSKSMAEQALQYLGDAEGLDYTVIRLGVVYGKHDHKIQGIHRLFFSLMDDAMPVLLTKKGIRHSYSHTKKIPPFVHYILHHRKEFSGQIYNFVDPQSVDLPHLILTIRNILSLNAPKEIYLPYSIANFGSKILHRVVRLLTRIGIGSRMPSELMFLENFYKTQTLSCSKLQKSSYKDPFADVTIYSILPELLDYYLNRWEQLNLISTFNRDFYDPKQQGNRFLYEPDKLLKELRDEKVPPFNECRLKD